MTSFIKDHNLLTYNLYKLKIFMFKKYLENYMIKIFNFLSKFWIKLNNKIKKKYLD